MKRMQNQTMPVKKQTWRDKATYVKKNWQLYLFFLMGCLEVHGLDLNISGGFYLHRIL